MLISVCVPTLNRPEYLYEALESIFLYEEGKNYFEICVSNNASEKDYLKVQYLIDKKKHEWDIKYVVQNNRLELDQHMNYVVQMATTKYCYLLGDDDMFVTSDLPKLINLVKDEDIDLAIFNGLVIDSKNRILKNHFTLPPRVYPSVETAFLDLRNKGSYGSILVKKQHLNNHYFKLLEGSLHAYGCYWLSILNDYYDSAKIIIPNFHCVYLRAAAKSYNFTEVYYRHIPFEVALYNRWLNPGKALLLHTEYARKIYRHINSVAFLSYLIYKGEKLNKIRLINPSIAKKKKFLFNYSLAWFIVKVGVFKVVLTIRNYQQLKKAKKNASV